MSETFLHGSCIEIHKKAVLITGRSGAGKSSLALQLMDRGAILVSDDQTLLTFEKGELMARPPDSLRGLLEVRGIGICSFPYQEKSPVHLCVEFVSKAEIERLPNAEFCEYLGLSIPCLKLQENDPLGFLKVELKLRVLSPVLS